MTRHRLCLIHPFDLRGEPADLVEKRLAAIVAAEPADFDLVVVGIDRVGDLALGAPIDLPVAGRSVTFVPVAHDGGAAFAKGLVRRLAGVRAAARAEISSISVHDFAWAPLARLVGRPIVLVVHEDPRAGAVAGRTGFVEALREVVALRAVDRIVGCDADFVRRCRAGHPLVAAKTELLAMPLRDATSTALGGGEEARIARLWERHRRLFDAHAVHRGHHAAA